MSKYVQSPGEKIKLARRRLGVTQQELADRLNEVLVGNELVERSLISRWEQDKNFPRNSRKQSLEKVLSIKLGSAPVRRDTFASYMLDRSEIEYSVMMGLQNCHEVWITNKVVERSIWYELERVKSLLHKLRLDVNCYFREIFYIQTSEDLVRLKQIISSSPPNYDVRIRVSPGHAFPVLLAPRDRFGVMLSGFFDDITSVGLEFSGQVAGFNEHYMRLIWNKATVLYEDGQFNRDNYRRSLAILRQLGGQVKNEFKERL